MNLAEMVSNCNAIVKPATNIDTLFKRWLSRSQSIFLSKADRELSWTILNGLSVVTEASRNEYALSPLTDLGKIVIFTRRGATKKTLTMMTREDFQERVPDPSADPGSPEFAYHSGYSPVQTQPSSPSVLTIVSTVGDTATLSVEGLNASGVLVPDEIILDGTTPVAGSVIFERVLSMGFNGSINGVVTVTSNSGAVTNAVVGPRMRQVSYPTFILYPTPEDAETWYYDAHITFPDLVNNADFSLFPEKYHDALEAYASAFGFLHKEDANMSALQFKLFESRVADAVRDDTGPFKQTILENFNGNNWVPPEGRFPGRFPR